MLWGHFDARTWLRLLLYLPFLEFFLRFWSFMDPLHYKPLTSTELPVWPHTLPDVSTHIPGAEKFWKFVTANDIIHHDTLFSTITLTCIIHISWISGFSLFYFFITPSSSTFNTLLVLIICLSFLSQECFSCAFSPSQQFFYYLSSILLLFYFPVFSILLSFLDQRSSWLIGNTPDL